MHFWLGVQKWPNLRTTHAQRTVPQMNMPDLCRPHSKNVKSNGAVCVPPQPPYSFLHAAASTLARQVNRDCSLRKPPTADAHSQNAYGTCAAPDHTRTACSAADCGGNIPQCKDRAHTTPSHWAISCQHHPKFALFPTFPYRKRQADKYREAGVHGAHTHLYQVGRHTSCSQKSVL